VGHKVIEAGELIERFDPCAPSHESAQRARQVPEVVRDAVAEAKATFKGWKGDSVHGADQPPARAGTDIGTRVGDLAAIAVGRDGQDEARGRRRGAGGMST